ncbi:hypothetical protein EVAR_15666_1 [Eumeta japonica]|uniref:Uncharacterized protein n=1 Tax=Eumeta variegata TaxID=151549 RepID=A0A4C1U9D4_EUMVA|nr:hypothetical protein EVAR_15666_1 [Eumeta japonica]
MMLHQIDSFAVELKKCLILFKDTYHHMPIVIGQRSCPRLVSERMLTLRYPVDCGVQKEEVEALTFVEIEMDCPLSRLADCSKVRAIKKVKANVAGESKARATSAQVSALNSKGGTEVKIKRGVKIDLAESEFTPSETVSNWLVQKILNVTSENMQKKTDECQETDS